MPPGQEHSEVQNDEEREYDRGMKLIQAGKPNYIGDVSIPAAEAACEESGLPVPSRLNRNVHPILRGPLNACLRDDDPEEEEEDDWDDDLDDWDSGDDWEDEDDDDE